MLDNTIFPYMTADACPRAAGVRRRFHWRRGLAAALVLAALAAAVPPAALASGVNFNDTTNKALNEASGGTSQWSGTSGNPIYYNLNNVGIGSSVPQAKLEVDGKVYFGTGNVGIGTSAPVGFLEIWNGAGEKQLLTIGGAGGHTNFSTVNVGIGSVSPMGALDIGSKVRFMYSSNYIESTTTFAVDYSGLVGIGTIVPISMLDVNRKLNVLSGGNVGIGTTVPQVTLDVEGTAYFGTGNVGVGTTVPRARLDVKNAGVNPLFTVTNVTPGDYLLLSSAGNVGVGTSVPLAKLEVEGLVYLGTGNVGIGSSIPKARLDIKNAGVNPLFTVTNSSDGDYLTVTSAGCIGIGLSAPGARLEVASRARLVTANNYIETDGFGVNTSGCVGIGTSTPLTLLDVNRLFYVLSVGNVGIGSSVPVAKLEVEGLVYLGTGNVGVGSSIPKARLDVKNNAVNPLFTVTSTTDGDYITVTSAGNLGIGSAAPKQKLEVEGSVYVLTNVGIGSSIPVAGLEIGNSTKTYPTASTGAHIQGSIEVDGYIYGMAGAVTGVVSGGNTSTAATVDWSLGNKQYWTANGNATITFTKGLTGATYSLILLQDGTARTMTWAADGGASVKWAGGSAPTFTGTNGKADIVSCLCVNTGSVAYYCDITKNF